jgi:hypothetical protein
MDKKNYRPKIGQCREEAISEIYKKMAILKCILFGRENVD